jgi:hypothetical protein
MAPSRVHLRASLQESEWHGEVKKEADRWRSGPCRQGFGSYGACGGNEGERVKERL